MFSQIVHLLTIISLVLVAEFGIVVLIWSGAAHKMTRKIDGVFGYED